ncbi:hypothetical protein ABZ136_37595, partial [Streptomyces microflavus]|uniref:hypothetical protein n=1 Tax=Streptomyces microflavus TaxID=1919 RepID=UPI0033BBDF50
MPLNRRQLITTAVATAVATGTTSRWATAATPRRHPRTRWASVRLTSSPADAAEVESVSAAAP